MGLNIGGLLKGAAGIIGGLTGLDIVSAVESISNNPTPEQAAALQGFDLQLKELALKELETEINAKVDLMKTEIQSEDAYVRRARPTGLYMFYITTAIQVIVVSLVILLQMEIDYLGLSAAFASITGPLGGYSAWYTYQRSGDKKNAVS